MRLRSPHLLAGCAALVAAAAISPLAAQQVFVANSSNGRISVFDPSGASAPFAGDTKNLVRPLGIALDGSGALIVADNQRDRLLRYESDGSGPAVLAVRIEAPDGPTFGPGGDLFFVSSPGGTNKPRSVYVIVGGSGPYVKIGDIPESAGLRETAVIPTGPFAGNLLVLSESPGFIARFSPDGAGGYAREADFVSSLPGPGTGMDFTTAGDLLVSGIGGEVWRYDNVGARLADFATGLGTGPTRLAIGVDGTVYVTNRNGPSLIRFDAAGNRLADFTGDLQSPAGVAIQSLNPTPVGTNVVVNLLPGLTAIFDQVVVAGFTTAQQDEILDPEASLTPCENEIPGFIQPPAVGPYLVTVIETTAGTTDTIEIIQDHPDGDSRLFHAPCPPDGTPFMDVTTLAVPGDPRGRVIDFSEFVVGRDARPNSDVVEIKLQRLEAIVAPGSPAEMWVDPDTLAVIRDLIHQVRIQVTEQFPLRAIDLLNDLKAFVRQESGVTIPNSKSDPGGNIAGALVADAATLAFSLSLEPSPYGP